MDLLKRIGVFSEYQPDVVIYDILGDIVCGGFGMTLRKGMADQAIVVTSADYLAIFAANNICKGIARYADRMGTPLGGFVYNVRGAIDDVDLVSEFGRQTGGRIIGAIPGNLDITENEIFGQTTIERQPDSDIAQKFRELATQILDNNDRITPTPLENENLIALAKRLRERARKQMEG